MEDKNMLSDEELDKVAGGVAKVVGAEDVGTVSISVNLKNAQIVFYEVSSKCEGDDKSLVSQLSLIAVRAIRNNDCVNGAREIVAKIDASGTTNEKLVAVANELRAY